MESPAASRPRFQNLELIIARTTLAIGFVSAIAVGFFYAWMWAVGVAIGAVLSWLSFRWLKQGIDALARAMTAHATQQKAEVPIGIYFKAAFRYGLIGGAVYVIFEYLKVPILSMIAGLFALGAATVLTSLYEILRPTD